MQISLPDGIFVRTWDSRIDLLGALIIGPHETPYEFAPFVFDLHFGASFPTSPPSVFFHSWTENVGRINPNLYEDGTVCLSLLGTWTGQNRDQEWQPKQSTTLQLPTSIMGLILVKEPYYSKPLVPDLTAIMYEDLSAFGSSTRRSSCYTLSMMSNLSYLSNHCLKSLSFNFYDPLFVLFAAYYLVYRRTWV